MEPAPEYYPKLWELLILLLAALQLVAAGEIIKRWWSTRNEPLPIPVAVTMWVGMAVLYFLLAATFYQHTVPDPRKFTVLFYTVLFWLIPLFYFTNTLREATAVRVIDRIGPFSTKIEDPSEFAAARKLALRGDVDGAVARYRAYTDNHGAALFEAARLLKSEDRYLEAAEVFAEAAEHYYGRKRLWAEAQYLRAKIYEVALNDPETAKELFRQTLNRAGETRFGQAAGADLARLQTLDAEFVKDPAPDAGVQDPFYRKRGQQEEAEPGVAVHEAEPAVPSASASAPVPTQDATGAPEVDAQTEQVVPQQDPFFAKQTPGPPPPAIAEAVTVASQDGQDGQTKPVAKSAKPRKPRAKKAPAKKASPTKKKRASEKKK